MTRTAKFSNGFEDTYKGSRPVTAAWMITRKDTGEVMASGHSLDRVKAQKTAEGNTNELTYLTGKSTYYWLPRSTKYLNSRHMRQYVMKRCREDGHADHIPQGKLSPNAAFAILKGVTKAVNAETRAMLNIEVLDMA